MISTFNKGDVFLKIIEQSRPQLLAGCGSALVTSFPGHAHLQDQFNGFAPVTVDSSRMEESLQEEIQGKFTDKKVFSSILADTYFELGFDKRAYLVADCGSFLQFQVSNSGRKLTASNFCRDRLCPMCNWRRSLKVFSQVSQVMDLLEKKGYLFLFLTLTLRNSSIDSYSDMVQTLFDGWRFFYHKHSAVKNTILGSFRSVETTINQKDHTFHAHIHCPIAVSSDYFTRGYITQKQWSNWWRESCKLDYNPVVDIRRFKPKPGSVGIGSAVAEAVKYSVKNMDFLVDSGFWRPRYVEALLDGLRGRRLVGMTGCFKEVHKQLKLDDPENGDLAEVDGIQLREDVNYMIVRYGWKNGVYVKI